MDSHLRLISLPPPLQLNHLFDAPEQLYRFFDFYLQLQLRDKAKRSESQSRIADFGSVCRSWTCCARGQFMFYGLPLSLSLSLSVPSHYFSSAKQLCWVMSAVVARVVVARSVLGRQFVYRAWLLWHIWLPLRCRSSRCSSNKNVQRTKVNNRCFLAKRNEPSFTESDSSNNNKMLPWLWEKATMPTWNTKAKSQQPKQLKATHKC